jgi:transcriptional regulator with XRE-family HTH domain
METDAQGSSARLVTVNQIVAWNISWYRRAAGMTQQQVADLLDWPHNKVSEAERSWDGKRTRQFDAQLLAELAGVFGIPIVAFFLPPLDDAGADLRFPSSDGEPRTMTDLMWLAMHDSDDQSPVLDAYRQRFRVQAQQYTDKGWPAEVERWFTIPGQAEAMADRAAALRARAAGSRDAAKLDEEMAAELEQAAARLK